MRVLRLSGLESPAGAPYADVEAQQTPPPTHSPLSGLASPQQQQQLSGGGSTGKLTSSLQVMSVPFSDRLLVNAVVTIGRGQLGMPSDPKVHRAHIKVVWLANASDIDTPVANNLPPSGELTSTPQLPVISEEGVLTECL